MNWKFLLVGFFAAMSTSAMGASGVIGGAQKIGKWAPRAAAGFAGAKTATWGKEKFAKSPKAQAIAKRLSETTFCPLTECRPSVYCSVKANIVQRFSSVKG